MEISDIDLLYQDINQNSYKKIHDFDRGIQLMYEAKFLFWKALALIHYSDIEIADFVFIKN
jgi:hypothetical protein